MREQILVKGDYVLATKYNDGDPCDAWCIGFLFEIDDRFGTRRFHVVDNNGQPFRANGFRRCEKISKERGDFILRHQELFDNQSGKSLWWWKRCSMKCDCSKCRAARA